jgi:membrane protein
MELLRRSALVVVGGVSAIIGRWTTPLLYALIFVSIFKLLPHAQIRWRDTWPGAILTALLFWLGNYLIGLYLSRSLLTSIYGAAGSVIVFLIWVYYSAWIILFGAKFTQIYADTYGRPIRPYPYMRLKAKGAAST